MPTEVSIIVAEPARIAAIRSEVELSGRVMHFTSGNLGTAVESIRVYHPRVVAIDAAFSQSPAGIAFLERIDALGTDAAVKLIVQHEGKWTATAAPAAAAPVSAVAEPPSSTTRRAPRFSVREFLDAAVDQGQVSLIDISILGAQLMSSAQLRPNQKIAIGLPDEGGLLDLVADVAWSSYECPSAEVEPYYRAGIEFAGSSREALEEFCLRHCSLQPLPNRGR